MPEERAGRILACPKCGHKMMVPGERKKSEPIASIEQKGSEPKILDFVDQANPPVGEPNVGLEVTATAKPDAQVSKREPLSEAKVASAKPTPPPLKKVVPTPPPLKKEPEPAVAFLGEVVTSAVVSEMPAEVKTALPSEPAQQSPVTAPATSQPAPLSSPAAQVSIEPARQFGYHHDADKVAAAYLLATLVSVLAVVSMVPAGVDIVRVVSDPNAEPLGRFTYLLLFGGALQLAYAVYLGQMADWSSSWVLTAVALLQAGMYAAALSSLHLAKGQSPLVPWFDLGPHVDNGYAVAWCFIMLLLASAVAYFCGRVSMRWRRAFQLVRTAYGR